VSIDEKHNFLPELILALTHNQHKLLRQAQSRHGRRKHGVFLCEGRRCCSEAIAHLHADAIIAALYTADFAVEAAGAELLTRLTRQAPQCAATVVDARTFTELAATENPQGILLLCRYPAPLPLPPPAGPDPFILVLDRIAEPGNLGTILRSAWAIGLTQVWLTAGTTDVYSPKAIRAGMGAQFALQLPILPDLDAVHAALAVCGYERLFLAMPGRGISCYSDDFQLLRSAVVIGNEASGVQACATAEAVTIPMPGQAESLNAAQAATILLFEGVRRGLLGGQRAARG